MSRAGRPWYVARPPRATYEVRTDGATYPAVVFAALCVAIGAVPASAAEAPPSIVTPAAVGAAWTADEIANLRADLDGVLDAAPSIAHAHVGMLAIDTANGAVLYERHADDDFQPASTLKLVVGSAALDLLGPRFRFHTTLALAGVGPPGSVPSLVLKMAGDPTFASSDLAAGVASLDVNAVGSVYVDDTAFDAAPYPAGWTWDDFAQDYAPNVSAATLDENVVTLRVTPGAKEGDPASISFADGRRMMTPLEECRAMDANAVLVVDRARTGAAGSEDTIDVARTVLGCPSVIGSIPLGNAPEEIGAAVYSPLVAVDDALVRALAARKITHASFTGGPSTIDAALRPPPFSVPPRVVWTHDSPPLAETIGPRFWIPSDNLFGELLLKELGRNATGAQGSTGNGILTERSWLQTIGVDPATATLADGCGMSQYDRITPRDLVTILQHDWNGPNRQLVLDSLPIGGVRGTIEGVMGPAAGRVFAKTGSMMHVRGLAGYLATKKHGAVTFAFEVDDWLGDYPSLAATRAAVLARLVRN